MLSLGYEAVGIRRKLDSSLTTQLYAYHLSLGSARFLNRERCFAVSLDIKWLLYFGGRDKMLTENNLPYLRSCNLISRILDALVYELLQL